MPAFIHISDTHLGFSDFDKIADNGVNHREMDVYNAFARAVDAIIQYKPDFVLHTGDLFHRASPSNRALIHGLGHIKRITRAGIPFIVIAGNHSTPKTVYTSPILQALQTIEGVYSVYNQQYECLSMDGVHFHCLPHIHDEALFQQQIDAITPKNGVNILLMHTSLGKEYLLEEYGERIFPQERLSILKQFDYIALGHWHNFQILPQWKNTCYSGSTERFSDREAGKDKGFVKVTLDNTTHIEFMPLSIRPWVRFDISCRKLSVEEIKNAVTALRAEDGSIVSIYLHDITSEQSAAISNMWISEQFANALIVLPKRIFKKHGVDSSYDREFISIDDIFSDYCKTTITNEDERKAIETLGRQYFMKYQQQRSEMKE